MIKEEITWKIDNIDKPDEYQNAIDFVHSFGLRSDCVGWCSLTINGEKDFELLKLISEKAKQKKGRTRCYYKKTETGIETDWYILRSNRKCDYEYESGIKAYRLTSNDSIAMADEIVIVNQGFVDFCTSKAYSGVEFAYMRDIGRYQANTYYALIPNENIKIATNIGISFAGKSKKYESIDYYNGNLWRISKYFDEMELIDYPIMISKEDEPKSDFCYVAYSDFAYYDVLVRKSVADELIKNKLISKSNLIPVRYCDSNTQKNLLCKCAKKEVISKETLDFWKENRKEFEKKKKPLYKPCEKEALRILRRAKRERPEDFEKPLSKIFAEQISDKLSNLKAIYKISNGFYINEEIYILPFLDIEHETKDFFKNTNDDFTASEFKGCYIIGQVANGDKVIYRYDGSVVVFDHEDYYNSKKYNSIWEFIFSNYI